MKTKIIAVSSLLFFIFGMQGAYAKISSNKTNTTINKAKDALWIKLKDFNPVEKKMVVIIPSYNNKQWYKKNLDSVFAQKYKNFHVIYVDDVSPDGTADGVEQYIAEHVNHPLIKENRFILIRNKIRSFGLTNIYNALKLCEDSEIAMALDGDDWFRGENVLSLLNKAYTKYDCWMTYGQMEHSPEDINRPVCSQLPAHVIKTNTIRDFSKQRWVTSQLRTFYVWLFRKIELDDLKYNGEFLPMSWDLAFMIPMLEMSGIRSMFIPDVIYIHNRNNPINDDKVDKNFQRILARHVLELPKYKPLELNVGA